MRSSFAIALGALLAAFAFPPAAALALEAKVVSPAPGETIEIVEGQPFSLAVPFGDGEAREARFAIAGGPTIASDWFAPYGDFIPTRHFRRIGIQTDVHYPLTVEQVGFGAVLATYTYDLLVHPLPVIPRVHLKSLILKGCACLVGFKLLNVGEEDRVMAWGIGFGDPGARFPFQLRLSESSPATRTYLIPGGRSWGRGTHPQITVSIAPLEGAQLHGVAIRGRVFTARLMTDRFGDTSFRQTDRWTRCSEELSHNNRPPARKSCVLY